MITSGVVISQYIGDADLGRWTWPWSTDGLDRNNGGV